jgi:23S rRNA (cytidine1920-2'-O)/16S rRNA (cytidine1409-2'-O)-methyltransferase
MMSKKCRLDVLLLEKKLTVSRHQARGLIMAGKVLVNGLRSDKPGALVSDGDEIHIQGGLGPSYVSRGGLKLEGALKQLNIDVTDLVCLDVGASTGGFSDCLLQHGAAKIYAVDVGYGQLAWQLRQDPRVIAIERTNIRHMPAETLPETVDLATVDVSFISLKIVIPAVMKFLKPNARILALIKPQFEVGKGKVGKGGVVRDVALRDATVNELIRFFTASGFVCAPVAPSPVLGPKGNQEFIALLTCQGSGIAPVQKNQIRLP